MAAKAESMAWQRNGNHGGWRRRQSKTRQWQPIASSGMKENQEENQRRISGGGIGSGENQLKAASKKAEGEMKCVISAKA